MLKERRLGRVPSEAKIIYDIHYRICNRCIMDTTDPEIQFD